MLERTIAALCLAALTSFAHGQYGQWAFGNSESEVSDQITVAQDGDLISCGHKTVRRHNGATMAFEWSTSVPGFYPSDVIEMSTGRIAAAGYHWSGDPSDPVTLTLVVTRNPVRRARLIRLPERQSLKKKST